MWPMYHFGVTSKILVNGDPWGYELYSMNAYIDFPVTVKNSEFLYLVKAGFISEVQLNETGNPVFTHKRRSFDTMRSRNLKTPPITGKYVLSEHNNCGRIESTKTYRPILLIEGLFTDTTKMDAETASKPITDPKDARILGYRLYCLSTHETYSLHHLETHQIFFQAYIPGIRYSCMNPPFTLVFEDEVAERYDFTGLPVFDLADEDCELPSGGHLERTDIFRLRELGKVVDHVLREYRDLWQDTHFEDEILEILDELDLPFG